MNEQDRKRFQANIQWFNQFFDGIQHIYDIVLDELPIEFFPERLTFTSENYYFPRQKVTPTIPPYYALMVEGYKYALQILTIVDASLISGSGYFVREPSIITIVHTQADKNCWVDEFALNVIGGRNVEFTKKLNETFWGSISTECPAEFFAFQVGLDKFSDSDNLLTAVRQHLLAPLTENLNIGFRKSPA
jgi:hypothetical protein